MATRAVVILLVTLTLTKECFQQSSRIDPKLDFETTEQDDSKGVKRYGVRVIVDASKFINGRSSKTAESEVFKSIQLGDSKNKKTIGIQTDIIFEDSKEEKADSDGKDDDPENASVPVFKGKSVDKENGAKPNTKIYYDFTSDGDLPVFPVVDDDSFRNINWFHFQPPSSGLWTTAKPKTRKFNDHRNFIPYEIGIKPPPNTNLQVQPCKCNFHDDHITRHLKDRPGYTLESGNSYDSFSGLPGIDEKLEYPFRG